MKETDFDVHEIIDMMHKENPNFNEDDITGNLKDVIMRIEEHNIEKEG